MVGRLLLTLFLGWILLSCQHKELSDNDPCRTGNTPIKVLVDWSEAQVPVRTMRINLFSQTPGVADYGRDDVPAGSVKYINLEGGASYRPFCYDYEASGIYFRNEQNLSGFEAYFAGMSRATYDRYALPTRGESTYGSPSSNGFYADAKIATFDVVAESTQEQVLVFKPVNLLRQFTFRINNIIGQDNIRGVRGAASGMSATYVFHTGKPADVRATMLFGDIQVGYDNEKGYGYLEGEFYTFDPVEPYENWFTVEILSSAGKYYNASWDVSAQVGESMNDRMAKLARDGYDILIVNDQNADISEILPGEGGSGGFDIGVGEWEDEVVVEL